jgi:hypothetical protein
MLKKLTLIFFLMIPTVFGQNRILDFSGDWAGKGTYILDGHLTQCSVMRLKFYADAKKFIFDGGERVCDEHSEKFYTVVMTYENGSVSIGNEIVGTYNDNEINVSYSMPDADGQIRHWRMSMRVEGNNLVYEERRIMNNDSTPYISFAGMLIRQ